MNGPMVGWDLNKVVALVFLLCWLVFLSNAYGKGFDTFLYLLLEEELRAWKH